MTCVIIGGGIAGFQAALTVRRQWPQRAVILIDGEAEVGYYRTLLPQFMVRTIAERKLFFWRSEDDTKLSVRTGVRVEFLDRNNRCVHLGNKEKIEYDRLIIASGGRPIMPPVCPDGSCSGIFPVRSLSAARTTRDWLKDHPQVVILGGGLVGVKTAAHLAHSNFPVTLIEKEGWLLPQAISSEASSRVESHLIRKNIRLLQGCSVEDIRLEKGELRAVRAGGEWIPCQTLLVAAGSVPEVEFLNDTGLLTDGKLMVTPSLQTADKRIFAVGDAVTIAADSEITPWTWPQAVTQGKLAAKNLYASMPVPLSCLSRVNCMNLKDFSLAVLGIPVSGAEVMTWSSPVSGAYRELYLLGGRLVGGVLVGDITKAGRLHSMMNSGEKIDEEMIKPGVSSFAHTDWNLTRQRQRAIILPSGEC